MPLSPLHASSLLLLPTHSFELRFESKMSRPFSDLVEVIFSEDQDSSLPWFQLRKDILPKINSSLSTLLQLWGTKQTAVRMRAAFLEHLETGLKRPASGAPERKICRVCVRVHVCEAFKLSTRKADQKVYAGRSTQPNFPSPLYLS